MSKSLAFILGALAVLLMGAGASRYINGTEIPQSKTLVTTDGAQAVTLGAVTSSSLTNSGALTLSSVSAGVTASTGGIGNGAITTLAAQVTVVTADNDVTLPTPTVGKVAMVCNADASDALDAFAPSGVQFNKENANTAIALAAGECMFCMGFSTTRYGCVVGSAN